MNIVTLFVLATALAPWQDRAVNSINRLAARELLVPCETEELAIKVARGDLPASASRWVISLNGEWDFALSKTNEIPKIFDKKIKFFCFILSKTRNLLH